MAIELSGLSGTHIELEKENAHSKVARTEPTAKQTETGKPSTTETVTITETAAKLRSLEQDLASLPVVDSQRVDEIKNAIANGEYEIDFNRIADKFMRFETALMQ